MPADTVTSRIAEALHLATYVDETLAATWTEAGATLAIAGMPALQRTAAALIPLGRDPVQGLRGIHTARCVAACLTSLGTATRLDITSTEHLPVRATVAVACCGSVTLLRHHDGRVERSFQVDGELVELLRDWADLILCPACGQCSCSG